MLDGFGAGHSDPYVIVEYGDMQMRSSEKTDTLNPVWNEVFHFGRQRTSPLHRLRFLVYDADVNEDDFIGKWTSETPGFLLGPNTWRATLEGQTVSNITFKVQWTNCLTVEATPPPAPTPAPAPVQTCQPGLAWELYAGFQISFALEDINFSVASFFTFTVLEARDLGYYTLVERTTLLSGCFQIASATETPTANPTSPPSDPPTGSPTTSSPTASPTTATSLPTAAPSMAPTGTQAGSVTVAEIEVTLAVSLETVQRNTNFTHQFSTEVAALLDVAAPRVQVQSIRAGSVVVQFVVVAVGEDSPSAAAQAAALSANFVALVQNRSSTLWNTTLLAHVDATAAVTAATEVHTRCHDGSIVASSSSCPEAGAQSGGADPTMLYGGGLLVVAVLLTLLAVCCCKRRRRKKKAAQPQTSSSSRALERNAVELALSPPMARSTGVHTDAHGEEETLVDKDVPSTTGATSQPGSSVV